MHRKALAVCALFENVASRLPEWLAYHSVVGVEHFVLYDNDSTDDPARVIRSSPSAEQVTLIRWRQRPGELAAYRHFIDIFAPGFEWAAFLGVDDFLLPLSAPIVLGALEFRSAAAAVLVQRRIFAPEAGQDVSGALAIETFGRRAGDDFPANRQVRVIARCAELSDVGAAPHEFRIDGQVLDTAGRPAPNAAVQPLPCYRNLVVNHYCLTSREGWLARVRQDCVAASGGSADAVAGDMLADLAQVADETIRAFVPVVRERMGLGPAPVADAVPAAAGLAASGPAAPTPSPVLAETGLAAPMPAVVAPAQAAAGYAPVAEAVAGAVGEAPRWLACGPDARERIGGTGLVVRDQSRPGEHWLAALRGAAAAGIDPAFLTDEFDRIREFADAAEACAACDEALAREAGA